MRGLFAFRRRADAFLMCVDLGVGVLAGYTAYLLRFGHTSLPAYYAVRYQAMTAGLALGSVMAGRASGLYRRGAIRAGESNVEPALEAALAVGVGILLINEVAMHAALSRSWIGLVTLTLLLFSIASRWLIRRSRRMLAPFGIGLERYALLGDDPSGRQLLADLTRAPGAPFVVTEVLSRDLPPEELLRRVRELRLDGLILPADTESSVAARLAGALSGQGVDVLLAPGLAGLEMRVASIAMLHGVPLLRATGLAPSRAAIRTRPRPSSRGVAILGTRGIPASYGGFETFTERLALELVAVGVPVTVYCRRRYSTGAAEWRGIRLVTLPTIPTKYLDTVVHTFLSVLHLLVRTRIRNIVLCNAANAAALPALRIFRRRVVLNVDGLEWRRTKWGPVGRAWYRVGEWLSVRWASVLVTDAEEVRTYYRVRHDSDSVMVPYGADVLERGGALPPDLGVRPDKYALYVSRWEPENNPMMVACAHARAQVERQLVMLGGATYDSELERAVREAAAPSAVLPGSVFGAGYRALLANARCYIHATEVGGTHPALIEAMAAGNLCLVLDTPENREVAGPDAWYFADESELANLLERADSVSPQRLARIRARMRNRAAETYSWERVAATYRQLIFGT